MCFPYIFNNFFRGSQSSPPFSISPSVFSNMGLSFTTHDGNTMEVNICVLQEDRPPTDSGFEPRGRAPARSELSLTPTVSTRRTNNRTRSPSPLIMVTTSGDRSPPASAAATPSTNSSYTPQISTRKSVSPEPPTSNHRGRSSRSPSQQTNMEKQNNFENRLIYNQYGELVDLDKELKPVDSENVTPIQALRLIRNACHHEVSHILNALFNS